MNQRLLVILAVLLLIVGAFGLLMGNSTSEPEAAKPVSYRQVNYFVSEKLLTAGSLLRDEDLVMKTESLPADRPLEPEMTMESLRGMFLVTAKKPGERILTSDISPDDPKNKLVASSMIRYNTVINERFTGVIQQLRPGDYVDVYLRFVGENTRARRKHSEGVLQGESSLNLFRIFEHRRVISRPKKTSISLLESQSLTDDGKQATATGSLSLDLELSPGDLKRLYLVTQKYEVILFPVTQDKVQRKALSIKQGTAQ